MAAGGGGVLVEGGFAEMARAVLALLADPARAGDMGRQGRKFVEGRFSMDRMVAAWEELYLSLVALGT